MSHCDRQKAELNKLIRERKEQGRAGEVEVHATMTVDAQYDGMADVTVDVWRSDGRRYGDPARALRNYKVELLYRSARAAGWSYKDAIALGAKELRQPGTGASSPKLVEAIIAKRRLPADSRLLDAGEVEAKAREHGMSTTVSSIKK